MILDRHHRYQLAPLMWMSSWWFGQGLLSGGWGGVFCRWVLGLLYDERPKKQAPVLLIIFCSTVRGFCQPTGESCSQLPLATAVSPGRSRPGLRFPTSGWRSHASFCSPRRRRVQRSWWLLRSQPSTTTSCKRHRSCWCLAQLGWSFQHFVAIGSPPLATTSPEPEPLGLVSNTRILPTELTHGSWLVGPSTKAGNADVSYIIHIYLHIYNVYIYFI